MEQENVERLLDEAREGERLIRQIDPEFKLEELISHYFTAFKDLGNVKFSVEAHLSHPEKNIIYSNIENAKWKIQELEDSLNAYKMASALASRRETSGEGDSKDYSIFEKYLSQFRLYYGRILSWKMEVDLERVISRIRDMKATAEYYAKNGNSQEKRIAIESVKYFNKVLDENSYISGLSNEEKIYKGDLSIEAIARDSFQGEIPRKKIKFSGQHSKQEAWKRAGRETAHLEEEEDLPHDEMADPYEDPYEEVYRLLDRDLMCSRFSFKNVFKKG